MPVTNYTYQGTPDSAPSTQPSTPTWEDLLADALNVTNDPKNKQLPQLGPYLGQFGLYPGQFEDLNPNTRELLSTLTHDPAYQPSIVSWLTQLGRRPQDQGGGFLMDLSDVVQQLSNAQLDTR
jgi:hypothetical protein